jgi:hypothetical protein
VFINITVIGFSFAGCFRRRLELLSSEQSIAPYMKGCFER